jgi:phenylacetate-CoA ligase
VSQFKTYWDEERETLAPEKRNQIILNRIQEQLHYVYNTLPFYKRIYDEHHFKPEDVKTLEDFTTKVPIITKKMLVEDQQKNPIYGSYAGDFKEEEIARIQGSSGTSGTPTFYQVSQEDWKRAADVHAMAQWCAGIRPDDVVQISFPFSLFFGGWGVIQGAERLGATVFPLGPVESEKQLELMNQIGSTVFSATPSYCMHLINKAKELGFNLKENTIKRLLVGGEAGGSLKGPKNLIANGWNASVHDCASASEMYPFQTNVECEAQQGVHVFNDEVYAEIVEKEDANSPVSMGEKGAIVYTHLWRKSQPMIRFWPGDESYMSEQSCSCGRTYPMLPEGVLGRLDDMIVVRGANIYPSAIENIVRKFSWSGPEYQVIVNKKGAMDEIKVIIEQNHLSIQEKLDPIGMKTEAEYHFKKQLGIRVQIDIHPQGTLPETIFKAKRVVDRRKEIIATK